MSQPEDTSRQLAADGMERALDHADEATPGWSDQAVERVRQFAHIRSEFLGEDVRVWAHAQGLPLPPVACAWGAVMVRAAREGIIERDGYATTRIPPQHSKPAVRWHSLVSDRLAA